MVILIVGSDTKHVHWISIGWIELALNSSHPGGVLANLLLGEDFENL